jgi:hypothetical protein
MGLPAKFDKSTAIPPLAVQLRAPTTRDEERYTLVTASE